MVLFTACTNEIDKLSLLSSDPHNLALNQPADSSSHFNADTAAIKAVDGNVDTRWEAANDLYPQMLVVDLGVISDLDSIKQTFGHETTWSYRIEASNDNVNRDGPLWKTLVDRTEEGVTGSVIEESIEGQFRYVRIVITGSEDGSPAASEEFQVFGTVLVQPRDLVPEPTPVATGDKLLIAQTCNLWTGERWWKSLNPPENKQLISIMGMYNEAYDVATDWQIKVAVENGISGFFSCWFRQKGNGGKSPVMASFEGMVASLANTAQYRDMIQWAIQWENINPVGDSITDFDDFIDNLVPFWIEEYFSKPNYLKIDGKPVLSIYSSQHFLADIGDFELAQEAIRLFREAVVEAGFDGLILMTANNLNSQNSHSTERNMGIDYVYSYHIPTFMNTMPAAGSRGTSQEFVDAHVRTWASFNRRSVLPYVLTASTGWDARLWGHQSPVWEIIPEDFVDLLEKAKGVMAEQPEGSVESRLILLDNWNEYAEGHYIFPTPKYGFGYVNAVRQVFGEATEPPENTLPDLSVIPQVFTLKEVTRLRISGSDGENILAFPVRSMQMEYIAYPIEDEGLFSLKWEVFAANGVSKTDIASISPQGLLSAEENGTVRVVATVKGQPEIKGTALITIDLNPSLESDDGNLALGKKTTASSYANYGDSGVYPPNHAVDGTEDTMWLVNGPTFPSILTVDLGQEYELSRFVQIFTGDGIPNVHFTVEGSLDGRNYTKLHTTNNTDKDITVKLFDEEIEGSYQYVRIVFLGGDGWPNSRQFEVYGPENEKDE